MIERHINRRDEPLTSQDLAICQRVFDAVKAEFELPDDSEEASRSASILIELYRQGVHDPEQLRMLVFAARGRI